MCVGLMGRDQRGRFKDSKGRGKANSMQDGAVHLQQGTGVYGNSLPCIQGHHPKYSKGFIFRDQYTKLLHLIHNTV